MPAVTMPAPGADRRPTRAGRSGRPRTHREQGDQRRLPDRGERPIAGSATASRPWSSTTGVVRVIGRRVVVSRWTADRASVAAM